MTDDRLMAMARAAGYSMIPPQDAFDPADNAEAATDTKVADAKSEAGSLYRIRSWIAHSAVPIMAMRDAVANWYHGRAHA